MANLEKIHVSGENHVMLLEPRPFKPFKSSEEYLYAMKEDLAEWLQTLYPELDINVDNFMEKLEDGVALCQHANNVRQTAAAYQLEQQAKRRKFSAHMEIPSRDVTYRTDVKAGSFFARDNVHNFIQWCKQLGIYQCLLFETDDLVLRKNEKSFILCLLEVARRGAKFGMLAPLLVQFEAEIDRELARDQAREQQNQDGDGENTLDGSKGDDAEGEDEEEDDEMLGPYGPFPQVVTNDLRSLDEMVRDLVSRCTCPTQFPMVRISEGKYRIGDTKLTIFVRILRKHVMVRVGGGWDTLQHFLGKHDPCRCKEGHRTAVNSKLNIKQQGATPTMQVTYERQSQQGSASPNVSRRSSGASQTSVSRKNSSAGLTNSENLLTSSPIKGRHSRQRSESPSTPLTSLRQRSQSPSSRSSFTRTSSGRYSQAHRPYWLNNSSSQHNFDSLESYDSGIPPSPCPVRKEDAKDHNHFSGDSSSEISDEGCRDVAVLAQLNVSKTNDFLERPDSSMTHASSSSGVEDEPSSPVTEAPQEKKSRIPCLESLKKLKRESASSPARERTISGASGDKKMPRSQSASNALAGGRFSRDSLGRHSLRTAPKTETSPYLSLAQRGRTKSNLSSTSTSGKNTWSGRTSMGRERPALTDQTFSSPPPGVRQSRPPKSSLPGSRNPSASPSMQRKQYPLAQSRSANNFARERTSSTHQSLPTSPQGYKAAFTWGEGGSEKNVSPLLQEMLTNVEVDNDASILKRMEEILNQYKQRVENHLAGEGRSLKDELENQMKEDASRSVESTPVRKPLQRRNSLGADRTFTPSPRRDVPDRVTPSKIPRPTFY